MSDVLSNDIVSPEKLALIRQLNDKLRTECVGGVILVSDGVASLSREVRTEVMSRVRNFHTFTRANNPHEENDMGMFDIFGETFMFAIAYYDMDLKYHSSDPSNSEMTRRVMWVGYAHER